MNEDTKSHTRFLNRLASVSELAMRVALWREFLESHHPDDNLSLVRFILAQRPNRHHGTQVAMLSFSRLLHEHRPLVEKKLLVAAVVAQEQPVIDLLIERKPAKEIAAAEVRVPRILPDRDLTLGERRSLARSRDRDVLSRLLTDPDAGVIGILLQNPRVLERDVLRIASGQPNRSEVLTQVFKNDRWCRRRQVQLALMQNPYTPSDVSRSLLELLDESGLREVAAARSIDAAIRSAAKHRLRSFPLDSPIDESLVKSEWVMDLMARRDEPSSD
ncbi:MAG: hypothetical protein CMH52_09930 [Myxococcales bacterium]|nr:hypothetical protein [Myxococcales bacterium]